MCGKHGETSSSERLGSVYISRDIRGLAEATEPYRRELLGFDPEYWLSCPENIAITDGDGNWALFDKNSDGIYSGHYFFIARGKHAKALALQMLDLFFKTTEVKILRGITPVHKLGARWMSRQLGFKGYGVIQTAAGPAELFIMIRGDENNG